MHNKIASETVHALMIISTPIYPTLFFIKKP
jgi:hypothetical protein